MKLNSQLVNEFLFNPEFISDMVSAQYPDLTVPRAITKSLDLTDFLMFTEGGNRNYFITDTVLNNIEKLKVNRIKTEDDYFNWTIFSAVPTCKKTFILSGDRIIRLQIDQTLIRLCWLTSKPAGMHNSITWTLFYVNRETGEMSDNFNSPEVKEIEPVIFKLMCFIFLSEIEEEILVAGQSKGSRKTGKVVNDTKLPVTIINTKWNITSIRTEGFDVDPHFGIRYTGPGRTIPKVVLIKAYRKKGYKRKAAKDS